MRAQSRPGFAVMLVLWLIVLLGALCSGVAMGARSASTLASNYRAHVVARYAAESGLTAAVALLEDSLARVTESAARRAFLNQLDRALGGHAELSLGAARTAISLVDVGSRLDVNFADAESLATLFAYFTDAIEASTFARVVREQPPLQSLEELRRLPGGAPDWLERAAAYLTVDGDGTINRATASDTVLAAARGELRDEPSRIVVISRGWLDGHPLTHEIEAVYAVAGSELTLVRWSERQL